MFNQKQEEKIETKSSSQELKDLLLKEGNNDDDTGLLHIIKRQLQGDLHQRKIARTIELLENL